MTNFNTLTEKQILDYAYLYLLNMREYEEEKLVKYPDAVVAPRRIARYTEQLRELNEKIIEIENAQSQSAINPN